MAKDNEGLAGPWRQIHSAIWLIGLAILFWTDWWWPGILVLVAISSLTQAALQLIARKQERQAELESKRDWLPAKCPQCGAPISAAEVRWTGDTTADCPYCGSNLKAGPSHLSVGQDLAQE